MWLSVRIAIAASERYTFILSEEISGAIEAIVLKNPLGLAASS